MKTHFNKEITEEKYQSFLEDCKNQKENNEGECAILELCTHPHRYDTLICKGYWITLSLQLGSILVETDYISTNFIKEFESISSFKKEYNNVFLKLIEHASFRLTEE